MNFSMTTQKIAGVACRRSRIRPAVRRHRSRQRRTRRTSAAPPTLRRILEGPGIGDRHGSWTWRLSRLPTTRWLKTLGRGLYLVKLNSERQPGRDAQQLTVADGVRPTDEAFAKIDPATSVMLKTDPRRLTSILTCSSRGRGTGQPWAGRRRGRGAAGRRRDSPTTRPGGRCFRRPQGQRRLRGVP